MSYIFNINKEPTGSLYLQLLQFALQRCYEFSLTWRNQLIFEDSAYKLETDLASFLIKSYESSEWPGTKLLNGSAKICRYRFTKESIKLLLRVNSLYSWLSPKYPEDIIFYKHNGKPWLITISHERDAYIEDDFIDIENEIKITLPDLLNK